jgi:hypothetical protein
MPFTFSHPAIVLPLVRKSKHWFSTTGLVIGSLTPDFEYFMRMRMDSRISHTFQGLILFDLPLGLLLGFIFHNIVRNKLYDNLPGLLKVRVHHFRHFNWNAYFISHWGIVIVSVLVGAASHLFWDGFTHNRALFVDAIPQLNARIDLLGFSAPLYRILQHASSVAGGLIVGFTIMRLPETSVVHARPNPIYWTIVISIAGLITTARLTFPLDQKVFPQIIVTLISATLIALIVTPLVTKMKVKKDVQ